MIDITFKKITEGSQLIKFCEGHELIDQITKNSLESINNNYPGALFVSDNKLFFKDTNEKYKEIIIDDVIDAACESVYEKMSDIKDEIFNNIDSYNMNEVVEKAAAYITLKKDKIILDCAFMGTKYAAKYSEIAESMIMQTMNTKSR